MFVRISRWALLAAMVLVTLPTYARGQADDGTRTNAQHADSVETRPWSVSPFIGAFLVDDDAADVGMSVDGGVLFGGRIGYRFHPNWTISGSYGYGPLTSDVFSSFPDLDDAIEIDGDLHVYFAAFEFAAPGIQDSLPPPSAQFVVSGGVGGMRYSYDEFTRRGALLQDVSWANELIIPIGIGVVFNAGESLGIRFDVRNHFQFCNEEDEPIDETEDFSHCPLESTVLSNPEFSGGIVIRF